MTDQSPSQVPATLADGIQDRQALAAMELTDRGAGRMMLPKNFNEVVILAQMMSRSDVAVPRAFRNNPGACMSVISRAMNLDQDPWSMITQAYVVSDQVAYMAQWFAAVVNTRAPIKYRPKYEYFGDGETRQCRVTVELTDGSGERDYVTPKKGEIKIQNSSLWKNDPDQQLGYAAIRALARRYFPEIVLGLYTPEEVQAMSEDEQDKPAKSFDALEARAQPDPQVIVPVTGTTIIRPMQADGTGTFPAPEPNEDYAAGQPAPGEQYFLAGDPFTETGRRALYKDGQKVSTVGPKEGIKVYRAHPTQAAAEAADNPASQAVAASSASDAGTAAGTPASGGAMATGAALSPRESRKFSADNSWSLTVKFAEVGARPDRGEAYMLGEVINHDPKGWTGNIVRDDAGEFQFWCDGKLMVGAPHYPSIWAYKGHPTPTASAPTAGPGQATLGSATPASSDSLDLKEPSPNESSSPSGDGQLEQILAAAPDDAIQGSQELQDADFEDLGSHGQAADESPSAAILEASAGPLAEFAASVSEANDWPQIALALRDLYNKPCWKEWTAEEKNRPRYVAFMRLRELNQAGYRFDFITNLQAYRCYIVWETDAAVLEFNHKTIQNDRPYQAMRSDDRNLLEQAYQGRMAELIAGANSGAPEERMD